MWTQLTQIDNSVGAVGKCYGEVPLGESREGSVKGGSQRRSEWFWWKELKDM